MTGKHDEAFEQFLKEAVQKAEGKDLLGLLRDFHRLRLEASPPADGWLETQLASVDEFIEHAKDYLRRNPPVTTYVLENGLGLRLQNHRAVPLLYVEPTPLGRDAVAITMPANIPGLGMAPSESHPITKGE